MLMLMLKVALLTPSHYIPYKRVECLNAFFSHPRIFSFVLLALKQRDSFRYKHSISSIDCLDQPAKRFSSSGLIFIIEIMGIRKKIVWLSLQVMERGGDREGTLRHGEIVVQTSESIMHRRKFKSVKKLANLQLYDGTLVRWICVRLLIRRPVVTRQIGDRAFF
jgi:hypothetical protein